MQTIDLRQAIVNRVQGNSKEQLTEVINSSIDYDERALPGLGVLFEMIWKQSDAAAQNSMVDSLYTGLHQEGASSTANPSPS